MLGKTHWSTRYLAHLTHFLYRISDSKKTSRFQFSVPDLWEIHSNLKQQKNFNSHDGFFRKSPFCTFSCINPGFGGPWKNLWIFLVNGTFIMSQKKSFCQKKFWISCTGSKVPFWQNGKIAKMALLNLCMKFEIFFGQKYSFEALWKWHYFFFRIMFQGPPNPGFMQEKVQKGDFLKKPSRKLKKNLCARFQWIPRRPGTLN